MNEEQILALLWALDQLWIASDRRPAAARALNELRRTLGMDERPEYKS